MNINIISSNGIAGNPATWNFEISQSDYNAFLQAYSNALPNDFVWYINSQYGTYIKVEKQITSTYQWIPYSNDGKYFIRYVFSHPVFFGLSNIVKLSFDENQSSNPTDTFTQGTIIQQPGGTSGLRIMAAYRPIVFDVEFMEKPPVTYCDIYFGGIYYKTLSKTTPENSNIYRFDISDACQEYLSSELAPINSNSLNIPSKYFVECFCRFRTSKYDSNGFISQEKIIPVQGTSSNAPVEGGGKQSLTFYVLNAVLQHENNQNFQKHLKSIPHLEITETPESKNTLPLTHRPIDYKICVNDSDFYPIVTCYTPKKINLQVKLKDGSVIDLTKELPQNGYYNSNNPIGCDII